VTLTPGLAVRRSQCSARTPHRGIEIRRGDGHPHRHAFGASRCQRHVTLAGSRIPAIRQRNRDRGRHRIRHRRPSHAAANGGRWEAHHGIGRDVVGQCDFDTRHRFCWVRRSRCRRGRRRRRRLPDRHGGAPRGFPAGRGDACRKADHTGRAERHAHRPCGISRARTQAQLLFPRLRTVGPTSRR
jgi:hypothetical protein